MKRTANTLVMMTLVAGTASAEPVLQDKTLVSWAAPANLTQRGGSILTIDDGKQHFDGIVFGECTPVKWMAGSDYYRRTNRKQDNWPAETVDAGTLVQMAVVYRRNEITIYRNGLKYAQYRITEPQSFSTDSTVLIGPRYLGNKAFFTGSVADARIYDRALTGGELAALRPGVEGTVTPWAWWTFDNPAVSERTGRFSQTRLTGGAKVENGKLILNGKDAALIAGRSAALPVVFEPLANTVAVPPDHLVLNYHLMHPGGTSGPSDPNAAFCLDGVYHLHYILRQSWQGERSFSFVHVTSPDMLHWTWQPTTLQPAFTGHGMFSGTGFITEEGRPAIIYHGQGSGKNWIVIAKNNQLSAWEKPYQLEVKNPDGTVPEIRFWDPDCFRIDDTYYSISGGQNPSLIKSPDLKHWTYVGSFLKQDLPGVLLGEDISCGNFFKLGDKWMLLCISHSMGCRYYIGDWDAEAEQFVPEKHGRMNWRREDQMFDTIWRDYFAPESMLIPDGRRVMWAWCCTLAPDLNLGSRTIQYLPRELSLPDNGTLRIKPIRELALLRYDGSVQKDMTVTGSKGDEMQRIAELPGDSVELRIVVDRKQAERKRFGLVLFPDGKNGGLPIILRPETGTLRIGTTEAPFAVQDLPENEDLELRIFIDKYLVEVFANDRQAMVAACKNWSGRRGLDAWSFGVSTEIKSFEMWKLRPTNQGFFEAEKNRIWQPAEK